MCFHLWVPELFCCWININIFIVIHSLLQQIYWQTKFYYMQSIKFYYMRGKKRQDGLNLHLWGTFPNQQLVIKPIWKKIILWRSSKTLKVLYFPAFNLVSSHSLYVNLNNFSKSCSAMSNNNIASYSFEWINEAGRVNFRAHNDYQNVNVIKLALY